MAAVIRRNDEFLVCQRPMHKRHGGLWEFPGGKCEPGESDSDALERELREELGIEVVTVGEPWFETRDDDSPFVIVFVPVETIGEPFPHEHAAVRWSTAGEMAGLELAPSDRRFINLLLDEYRLEERMPVTHPTVAPRSK
jgi:8-oxo-dGTP diphosphatase